MYVRTARWPAFALTVGLAVGVLAEAPAAVAAPSAQSNQLSTVQAMHAGGQTQTPAATAAYWTPERMRTATPAVPGARNRRNDAQPASPGQPGNYPPAKPTSPSAQFEQQRAHQATRISGSDTGTLAVNASPTVGRVFFFDPSDGRNHSCSASSLNSGSRLLVITAGHCVHGGSGRQWMESWVFVPYYNNGSQPYGTFSAKWLTTYTEWINNSSMHFDTAMVTVWPNEYGQRLVDAVGGNGLAWNWPRDIYLTILAYPADPPYDGTWQWYCQGNVRRVSLFDPRIEIKCGFTGGSSGGPWLKDYDNTTLLGYVNGNMSTLTSDGWNRSPYFNNNVKSMFDHVADRT